ncbi:MAG: hypothetical protein NT069_08395, partial [Planctomycetota bacterium]|nr:hypothetical protein [Planctomycetota bacterium]
MRIVVVCVVLAFGAVCGADDVANVGAFEFDHLPHQGTPGWNLDNLEYPAEAITIERISAKNQGLRIGRPDGSQTGRYTITLRASTHDWDPTAVGVTHSTNVKLAADYRGTVQIAISIPGAGALLDLGNGKCVLWQRVGETDERIDETPLVRERISDWRGSDLHDYRLEWTPGSKPRDLACRLLIDGQLIKEFEGHSRPSPLDSTLEISFESGTGTGLIDQVSWNINGGVPKPNLEFTVERGTRQLFLDDFGVQEVAGLTRKMHSPDRHAGNPVLRGEFPWEKNSTSVYGTMLYDEARKRFRLWYLCSPESPASGRKWLEVGGYRRVAGCTLLAYAESDDAVHWEK